MKFTQAAARTGKPDAQIARGAQYLERRLEHELSGAVAKRPLEPVHDQTIAVAAEALERERGTRDIAA